MSRLHPNVYPASQQWSEEQVLHVATAYSNPFRWRTRRELMNNFKQHMASLPNIVLHVGELAYGDRPFEVTGDDLNDVQFRTNTELFHKENIINEIIKKFPSDWKYGAYVDGDFAFTRQDIGLETIHQLQHHFWVQMFSHYLNLPAKGYTSQIWASTNYPSFMYTYTHSGFTLPPSVDPWGWSSDDLYYPSDETSKSKASAWSVGALGGAWAFTRAGFETTGGLLDTAVLGHADWFMTFGLVAKKAPRPHASQYSKNYTEAIDAWQRKAFRLKQNIGYVDAFAVHHFHGAKKNRKYGSRDLILVKNQFDPIHDLRRNAQGIYELVGNKPRMRDAIRRYFIERSEDDTGGDA